MRYYYKVTLLADVVMSSLSSTEVSESLDYLSGSAFMGIAANYLFKNKPEEAFDGVFSGKIRFLDAHPLIAGKRSFKIPLCLHKPKVAKEGEGEKYYFRAKVDGEDQLKQVRKGFFVADGTTWTKVEPEHQYTMKSSYDSKNRRAEEGALFGYDALAKGSEWVFVMEFDEDDKTKKLAEDLDKKLFNGKTQRIGKSKTSQYGNVKIERIDELPETPQFYAKNEYWVYADSRLCFFDENGQPTFQPTAEQLGFKEGTVLWNKSFVRKYIFTPRNSTRNAYDGDIACIDKGSVIVVDSASGHDGSKVVGEYRSIGLGQIIVNPKFLEKEPDKLANEKKNADGGREGAACDAALLKWLDAKAKEKKAEQEIAENVTAAFASLPTGISPSQWGVLRAKARAAIAENKPWWDKEEKNFKDEIFKEYLRKKRLNKKWGENKVDKFENIFTNLYDNKNATNNWTDLQKLRFFELLCAAAAKEEQKKAQTKGGKK